MLDRDCGHADLRFGCLCVEMLTDYFGCGFVSVDHIVACREVGALVVLVVSSSKI